MKQGSLGGARLRGFLVLDLIGMRIMSASRGSPSGVRSSIRLTLAIAPARVMGWSGRTEPFVRAAFTKRTGIEVSHTIPLLSLDKTNALTRTQNEHRATHQRIIKSKFSP